MKLNLLEQNLKFLLNFSNNSKKLNPAFLRPFFEIFNALLNLKKIGNKFKLFNGLNF